MKILSPGFKRHIFINACMYEAFCFILGDKLCDRGVFLGGDLAGMSMSWGDTTHQTSDTVCAQTSPQMRAELLLAPARLVSQVNQHRWLRSRGG